MTERGKVLDDAKAVINGERQNQYGDPEDSFRMVSNFWSDYLGIDVSPRQAAEMMVLLKIARQRTGRGKWDNYVDMCGYASLAADIAEKE